MDAMRIVEMLDARGKPGPDALEPFYILFLGGTNPAAAAALMSAQKGCSRIVA